MKYLSRFFAPVRCFRLFLCTFVSSLSPSLRLSLFLFLYNFLSFYLSRNLSLKWLTFSPSITVYLFVSLSLSLCHSFFHFCPSPQMLAFIYSSIDWVIWLSLQFLITVPLSLFSYHATLSLTLTLSNALTHSGSCVSTPKVSVSYTSIIYLSNSLSLSFTLALSLSLSLNIAFQTTRSLIMFGVKMRQCRRRRRTDRSSTDSPRFRPRRKTSASTIFFPFETEIMKPTNFWTTELRTHQTQSKVKRCF